MSSDTDARALVEQIRRKGPEFLNLMTAQTDAEFEKAFDAVLGPVVARMEENKTNLAELNEEGLSAFVAMGLAAPGLRVSQEKNSNGHVDITIEATYSTPVRKKLGEAKIYDGYGYHTKGLNQLIERYSTGREGRGLLIVYFKKPNISGLLKKLRKQMDQRLPCAQKGPSKDHVHKWSFLTAHAHSSGESLEVSHVGCNLHTGS